MLEMMTSSGIAKQDAEFLVTLEYNTDLGVQAYVGEVISSLPGPEESGSSTPEAFLLDGSIPVLLQGLYAESGSTYLYIVCESQNVETVKKRAYFINGQPLYINSISEIPYDTFVIIELGGAYSDTLTSPVTVSIGKNAYYASLYAMLAPMAGIGYLPASNLGDFAGWGNTGVVVEGLLYSQADNGTVLAIPEGQDAATVLSSFDLYVDGVYVPWGQFSDNTVYWQPSPAALQFQDDTYYQLRLE